MAEAQYLRQFKGCCRLITVQLARTAESYDVEECLVRCVDLGKLTQGDCDFIRESLRIRDGLDAGTYGDYLETDARVAIARLQKLAATNLNCGDSA